MIESSEPANYPALMLTFNVFHALFTLFLAWYARKVARLKATEYRFRKIEKDVDERAKKAELENVRENISTLCKTRGVQLAQVELNTAQLRTDLAHLPTQGHIDTLHRSMSELSGALSKTQGRLEGINRAVDLINEFLINQGGGKR